MTSNRITITVSDEHIAWLDEHIEIRKSGVFKRAVQLLMDHGVGVFGRIDDELKVIVVSEPTCCPGCGKSGMIASMSDYEHKELGLVYNQLCRNCGTTWDEAGGE